MKQIDNEYYKKFCKVLETYSSGAVKKCSATMKDASFDDNNKMYVYWDYENNSDYDIDMTILKLDEFSKIYNSKNTPNAVDAVCIDHENNWYLIEFKNQKFDNAKSSVKKKMMSSLWILFDTYHKTGNISDIIGSPPTKDIIEFSKEHITYIVVCSSTKNSENNNKKDRSKFGDNLRKRYTDILNRNYNQSKLDYCAECYCFKDAYKCSEKELKNFIEGFI
ncbi:MAG: hypothetical protein K2K66_08470 [Ruminococcus sp.]|nr:hypothetical protein [Ruminococcus sp.]